MERAMHLLRASTSSRLAQRTNSATWGPVDSLIAHSMRLAGPGSTQSATRACPKIALVRQVGLSAPSSKHALSTCNNPLGTPAASVAHPMNFDGSETSAPSKHSIAGVRRALSWTISCKQVSHSPSSPARKTWQRRAAGGKPACARQPARLRPPRGWRSTQWPIGGGKSKRSC